MFLFAIMSCNKSNLNQNNKGCFLSKPEKCKFPWKIEDVNPDNVNITDEHGETALMKAAILNNKEMVKKLLENNADVNSKDNLGRTALMFAALSGNVEVISSLLIAKADHNAIDIDNASVLIYAVIYKSDFVPEKNRIDTLKVLLGKGAALNAKDKYGKRAEDYARENGYNEAERYLKGIIH